MKKPMEAVNTDKNKSYLKVFFALLFLILLPLGGFYIGVMSQQEALFACRTSESLICNDIKQENKRLMAEKMNPVESFSRIGNCTKEGCLFGTKYNIEGFGNIKGYYLSEQRTAWNETKNCDEFVITGGNETIANYFKDLVKQGNTVNKFNENGQVAINLNLKDLTPNQIDMIKNSKASDPVVLQIIRYTLPGKGAPVCTSMIEIINSLR